jgi:uncharacterized protein YaaQ
MTISKVKAETSETKKDFSLSGVFAFIPPGELMSLAKSIDEIRLLEKNPRINDPAAVKLAELIKENGFRKPIVIDENGIVRAGNTAYKAAKILQMVNIPAVRSAFISEAQAMKYVISDNKASEYSSWNYEILRELVSLHKLDKGKARLSAGLTDSDMRRLFEVKKQQALEHRIEVVVSCTDEQDAQKVFNILSKDGYKCRVLSL